MVTHHFCFVIDEHQHGDEGKIEAEKEVLREQNVGALHTDTPGRRNAEAEM